MIFNTTKTRFIRYENMTHPRTSRSPSFKSRTFGCAKPRWHTRISQTSVGRTKSVHFNFFSSSSFQIKNANINIIDGRGLRLVVYWSTMIIVEVLSGTRAPIVIGSWAHINYYNIFSTARVHNKTRWLIRWMLRKLYTNVNVSWYIEWTGFEIWRKQKDKIENYKDHITMSYWIYWIAVNYVCEVYTLHRSKKK